ncbi:MAG TPA: ferredoxin [Actinocrinis sp.]|nr:ferredoxin [Actinocrinis sp.]
MTMNAANPATATASAAGSVSAAGTGTRLRLDPTRCSGHGLCAELLGEHIALDDWGYPIIADRALPAELLADARRAVADCPALALRLDGAQRADGGRRR